MFVTIRDISFAQVSSASEKKRDYDQSFSLAVDSAVNQLVIDETGCIFSSHDNAYTTLLNSLYTSFDLNLHTEGKQRLELFLPIIAIADNDGLYVFYYEEEHTKGKHLERVWSERIPYEVEYKEKHYEFTLSGNVIWYDEEENIIIESNLSAELENVRKDTISKVIEQSIINYINQHNTIAKQYGIQYNFQVPAMDNSLNSRAITSPSLLVLFQGYPLTGTDEVYQCFAFAGASLRKHNWYVLTKKDWYYLYHRNDCKVVQEIEENTLVSEEIICETRKECSSYGAFPCPDCIDLLEDYSYLVK